VKPEIEAYLRDNGARYTTKALRAQLLRAGHEALEVDTALAETEAVRAPKLRETQDLRGQFWGVAFLINLVVLIVVTVLVSQSSSAYASAYAGAVFAVLGIAMLIGLGISGSIGSSLLPGNRLLVALVAPAVAALVLGGACYAMMQPGTGSSGSPPETKHPGTMELQIDAPVQFTGSASVTCYTDPDAFAVSSNELGSIGGKLVSVSINAMGSPLIQPSDSERKAYVQIQVADVSAQQIWDFGVSSVADGLPMHAVDGASGSITFEGLTQQPLPGVSPLPDLDSISGSIIWTCDLESQIVSSNRPRSSNGP
jgi:hypothetical protein